MVNPFPLARHRGAGRADAHHNPMEPLVGHRSGRYRPKVVDRAPRCIPDERFDELFAQLGSHRDRALVAFWVSTGARASELLGATVADVDPGQQLITVIRKGTRAMQPLPAAPDAFVWLRLYQAQLAGLVPAGRDQPLWWTLREPLRALRYDAARAMFNRANAVLGANWSLHDLRHTAAYRMARDPQMPLTDVQWVLGHAHLSTTQRYLNPVTEDVIAEMLAFHARRRDRDPATPTGGGLPRREPADPLRRGRVVTAVDTQAPWRRRSAPSPVAGSVKSTGAQLVAAFPPRPLASSWPATEAARSAVLARVLAAPFALDNPLSQQTRRLGVLAVLGWLRAQPGDSWQQRWQASGAEDHPDWRLLVGTDRAKPLPHLSLGAAGADLRRCDPAQPGLAAAVRPGAAQPGRRDGPHPRRRGVRRAGRAVSGPGRTAKPAAGADQHRDHHGRQGRKRRGGAGRRLRRTARRRRAHPRHQRPARAQPVVLSAAARARRPRAGRARRDRNVLRPWATQLRAADRPLPHRLPPGARRAGRLPARTPAGGGLLLAAAPGLPAGQAVLGRSGGPPPRHRLAAAAPRRRRGVEAARAHPPEGHQGQRPGQRAAAGRAQRAHRGTGLLPRPGRVGRRRPGPLGAVGGALPGQRQRRLPQEGPLTPQVPHGPPHPRTAAGAADPGRLGGGRTSPHRRAARRRRAAPSPASCSPPPGRPCAGRC